MLNYEALKKTAAECGFTHAGPVEVSTFEFLPEVRDMCAADRCQHYNKSWACPPACGTLEEMRDKVKDYSQGILVQTVGKLEDELDWDGIQKTMEDHAANFLKLWDVLDQEYPNLLAMGTGSCMRCSPCTFSEGKPCRFPNRLAYSMEAYGLFISKLCADNGLKYNYGPNTVAYTACFLLE